jgi:hypothetical protein
MVLSHFDPGRILTVNVFIKRVGNLLGEGKARRAGVSANTSLVLALAMSGISRSMPLKTGLFSH